MAGSRVWGAVGIEMLMLTIVTCPFPGRLSEFFRFLLPKRYALHNSVVKNVNVSSGRAKSYS